MTETDIRAPRTRGADEDDARFVLMRRKLAERGLQSQGQAQAGDGTPVVPVLSDGQRRMWFVQTAEPEGALLNVCVSFVITGALDHQRLRHTLGHALPADGFNYIYIDRRFHAAAFFDTKLKNVPLVLVCYT